MDETVEVRQVKRVYYLDVLRVLACLSVVMIHTTGRYVENDIGSLNFWIGNVLDASARMGAPLFVMISGALLLDQDYQYSAEKNRRHISRLIRFFVFWSSAYCVIFRILIPKFIDHQSLNYENIIHYLITGHFHLWFIYMLIGLYLVLPLLRLWVKEENVKWVRYFLILAFVFNFLLPQVSDIGAKFWAPMGYIREVCDSVNIRYVGGFMAYFVLGWYLKRYELKQKKMLYGLGTMCVLAEIVMTYVLSVHQGKPVQMYGNMQVNVLLQTAMWFVLVKACVEQGNKNVSSFVRLVSQYSLGIYALHAGLINILYRWLDHAGMNKAYLNIPVVFVCSFTGALGLAVLLGKNRMTRNLVV
ncbi:MAG: acyltransferase family protein [Lachnospiraceae bacterium]|nr:acyltransferase family protein [Lachnospiraceae bacterium]